MSEQFYAVVFLGVAVIVAATLIRAGLAEVARELGVRNTRLELLRLHGARITAITTPASPRKP